LYSSKEQTIFDAAIAGVRPIVGHSGYEVPTHKIINGVAIENTPAPSSRKQLRYSDANHRIWIGQDVDIYGC
jgi:hypothetical protein